MNQEPIFKGDIVKAYLYPRAVISEVLDVGPEGVTLNLKDDEGYYLVVRRSVVERVRRGGHGHEEQVLH